MIHVKTASLNNVQERVQRSLSLKRRQESQRPTTGLVLGGGGLVGAAFHAGVLAALEEATGWDPRSAEAILGTSAGSRTGALLRSGLSASDLYAYESKASMSASGARLIAKLGTLPELPTIAGRPRFQWPRRSLVKMAVRHPWQARAGLLAAVIPTGPFETKPFAETLRRICGSDWPVDPLWIVAARLPLGERVVFGRAECPACDVPAAVAASCAVPGLFAPVEIADGRYVDGGIHSATNADLLEASRFETVVIVSPMSASRASMRRLRLNPIRLLSRMLLGEEVRKLRQAGSEVIVFQPGPDEQRIMGLNALDSTRCPSVARAARETVLTRLEGGKSRGADERLAA